MCVDCLLVHGHDEDISQTFGAIFCLYFNLMLVKEVAQESFGFPREGFGAGFGIRMKEPDISRFCHSSYAKMVDPVCPDAQNLQW